MDRYGSSTQAASFASTSALTAGFEVNERIASRLSRLAAPPASAVAALVDQSRMAADFSQLMAPPPVLGVDFPRLEFPVPEFPRFEFPLPAFPKFESPPALIGMATPPGAIDLFDGSAILVGYSTLRDALTAATAAFEHSGIREVIDCIAKPPDYFIPEFSISAFPEFRFTDAVLQDDYEDPTNAVGHTWSQMVDSGSWRDEDRRAVYVVTKRVGKGLLLLIKWGGLTVAAIVAKHYLEPYLVLLPQP